MIAAQYCTATTKAPRPVRALIAARTALRHWSDEELRAGLFLFTQRETKARRNGNHQGAVIAANRAAAIGAELLERTARPGCRA